MIRCGRLFLHQGVLLDYKIEIITVVVLMLILVLGPLLVFSPQLARAWQRGEQDYGPLAVRYAHEFRGEMGTSQPAEPGAPARA